MNRLTLTILLAGLLSGAHAQLDVQVEIPAGSYLTGRPEDGNKPMLGAFEMDKYEISIGEYAKLDRKSVV